MARSSAEFYEWVIRVTNLIRAQQDPHDRELFEIFARELGQVLPFDALGKYDATSGIRMRSTFVRLSAPGTVWHCCSI